MEQHLQQVLTVSSSTLGSCAFEGVRNTLQVSTKTTVSTYICMQVRCTCRIDTLT